MKRSIILTTVFILIFSVILPAAQQKKGEDIQKKLHQLYKEKKYDQALVVLDKAMARFGASTDLMQMKYNILVEQKKYDDALAFVADQMKKMGETQGLLAAKYNLLVLKKDWFEAEKTAKKKYENAKVKTPWDCLNVMHVHLEMKNTQLAMDWLEEAVRNGFINYRILESTRYKLLEREPRFYEIVNTIKAAVGLGDKAKDFSATLISGESFSLSGQKGKVILLVFWATWCDPCIADMPRLNKIYKMFKDQGLDILAVGLDTDRGQMQRFLDAGKPGWKFIYSGKKWDDPVVKTFRVNSLPTYFIIDKKGVLRAMDLKGEPLAQVLATLLKE